jgi:hypothetical protein
MDHLFHVQHYIDLASLVPVFEMASHWLRARF